MKKLLIALGAMTLLAAPLQAATLKVTEGTRATVDGSDNHYTDADNSPDGYSLGTLGVGAGEYSNIDIHGRIVGKADYFNFTAATDFVVEFIFEDVFVNSVEILSGFVRENGGNNASDFTLDLNGGSVGSLSFLTNIVAGDNSFLFSGTAGTLYTFGVDSTVVTPNAAATYDIRISAVPLPAGGLLLLTAIGGLGLSQRRKKAS